MIVSHLLPEDAAPQPKRWTLKEFIALDREGHLGPTDDGERYELLDGEILTKLGQNEPHIATTRLVVAALRLAFGEGFDVNAQLPLHLGRFDAPEPDITVLKGTAREFARRTPTGDDIALVVEVADSRLDTAIGAKVGIYAAHGIAEYWVVDLRHATLRVFRGPRPKSRDWESVQILEQTGSVTPLGMTEPISVADLLP